MVNWLGITGKELHTPLLPNGSEAVPTSITVQGEDLNLARNSLTHSTAADADTQAVSKSPRRASSSSTSAANRRRRRQLHHLHSRQLSVVSTTSSEVTRQIDNINLDDDGSSEAEEGESVGHGLAKEKMTPAMMAKLTAVVLATTAGIASYLVAIMASVTLSSVSTVATTLVGVAGGVYILIVPLVWVSEWRLTWIPALRRKVNYLQHEAERFQREMDVLVEEEGDLRVEMESLQQDHDRLKELVNENNAGKVDELVALVQENQVILKKMKENLRRVVLQDVVKIVLQSDLNHDGKISKREADILETRLVLSLQIYGIVFDTQKFQRAVGLSPSLCGVMTIVRRLLPDENNRLSSFYSVESDSEEEEEEEEEDVYDMFYVPVEEQFNKGCAETIRLCKKYLARKRRRPTLMSIAPSLRKSFKGLRCQLMNNCGDD